MAGSQCSQSKARKRKWEPQKPALLLRVTSADRRPEQRIAILDSTHLAWASPDDLFVYEYDWEPDGKGFVGTAAHGDGDNNWWIAKLYAFDATTGSGRIIYSPESPRQQLANPRVSRDGRTVAFIAGLMSDASSTGGNVLTVTGGCLRSSLETARLRSLILATGLPQ